MVEGQTEGTVQQTEASQDVSQGIQDANIASLEKTDAFEAGLQQPVKLASVADTTQKVYGEKQSPIIEEKKIEAPVAAPIQQIAPVSANGEQTSSRESMKGDAPPIQQNAQVSSGAISNNPSAQENAASPSANAPDSNVQAEPEVAFEDLPPLEQANNLLGQIPGRFRLY